MYNLKLQVKLYLKDKVADVGRICGIRVSANCCYIIHSYSQMAQNLGLILIKYLKSKEMGMLQF